MFLHQVDITLVSELSSSLPDTELNVTSDYTFSLLNTNIALYSEI